MTAAHRQAVGDTMQADQAVPIRVFVYGLDVLQRYQGVAMDA